jgi:hypothetical protein
LKVKDFFRILIAVVLMFSVGLLMFKSGVCTVSGSGNWSIVNVVSCDASGNPQNYFGPDSEYVLLTANVYDIGNNPLGVACSNISIGQGESAAILSLAIPKSATIGNAIAYADAYSDWPLNGGVPLCPEVSTVFLIDPPVLLGDVTGQTPNVPDGKVNILDFTAIIAKFGTKPSSPNWNPNMDLNKDGVVGIRDLAIAISNFTP